MTEEEEAEGAGVDEEDPGNDRKMRASMGCIGPGAMGEGLCRS